MKKLISVILVLLCLSIAALLYVVAQQPAEYTVTKTKEIALSQEQVFPHIANLRNWRGWSPWIERDPEMDLTYNEIEMGRGAQVSWSSKSEGSGRQTITDVIDKEAIKMKLEFTEPWAGEAFIYFRIKMLDDTSTQVSWQMEAQNKSFIDKFFHFVCDPVSLIEKDFERGLQNLKSRLEKS